MYQRLASEAESMDAFGGNGAYAVQAIPLSKLAEVFGIAPKSNVGGA